MAEPEDLGAEFVKAFEEAGEKECDCPRCTLMKSLGPGIVLIPMGSIVVELEDEEDDEDYGDDYE